MQVMNAIKDINMIIPYALTDEQLAEWTVTIFRLYGKYEDQLPEIVCSIVDCFLTGKYEYNKEVGIVNITYRISKYIGAY